MGILLTYPCSRWVQSLSSQCRPRADRTMCASIIVITQMGVNTPTGPQDKVMSPGQRYTEIIEAMQDQYPNQFLRRALFDGVKNLYSLIDLQASIVFATTLNRQGHVLTFEVKLSLVSTIEPEYVALSTLNRFPIRVVLILIQDFRRSDRPSRGASVGSTARRPCPRGESSASRGFASTAHASTI